MTRVTKVTVERSCAICERTLLMGDRATRFSPNGGADYVDVCPLCAETAVEYGWIREGAPTTPTVPTERRRGGRRGILATIMGTRSREIEETIAPDPILRRLSVPARVEFTKRFMPTMLVIMPTLVTMNLGAGFQLARMSGHLNTSDPRHAWVVVSMCVVGVMAVVALAVLSPANLAVLFELRKPQPDGEVIARLMKRFIYTAGITGAMQVATLIIMTRLASN